jgi:hypothetical protein
MESCPLLAQRDYFRTALALAQMQKKDYERAGKTLQSVPAPRLEAPTNILRFHTAGELGRIGQAKEAWVKLRSVASLPGYREVGAELHRRYIAGTGAEHSDDWLIESEMKLLLAA